MDLFTAAQLDFFEPVTLKGEWWVPGHGPKRVTGTLHIDAGGDFKLELDGVLHKRFPKEHRHMIFHMHNEDVIYGHTENHQQISLYRCVSVYYSGQRAEYVGNYLVMGAHVKDAEKLKFESLNMSVALLEEWVAENPYTSENLDDDRYSITYTTPKDFVVNVLDRKLTIEIKLIGNSDFRRFKSATIEHRCSIVCKVEGGIRWKEYRALSREIQELLSLLAGGFLMIRHLGGTSIQPRPKPLGRRKPIKRTKSEKTKELTDIAVCYSQRDQDQQQRFLTPAMLFSLPHIRGEFQDICIKWFESTTRNRGIYNVFFTSMRDRKQYMEARFFHLAQCLEAYHRKQIKLDKGSYVTKAEFKQFRKKIVAKFPKDLPGDLRKALERSMGQANNLSFRQGLADTFGTLEDETLKLITDDVPKFIAAIVETRNLFTHLDPKEDSEALPEDAWFGACRKLEMLLIILMLKLCGIDEKRIRERLKSSSRYDCAAFCMNEASDSDVQTE